MPLVDDVRQREPVRDDDLAVVERRADDLLDQLRPRRQEQERLRPQGDTVVATEQDELTHLLPECGPAGVGAGDDGDLLRREPVHEHGVLRGLARPVRAVERDERGSSHERRPGERPASAGW